MPGWIWSESATIAAISNQETRPAENKDGKDCRKSDDATPAVRQNEQTPNLPEPNPPNPKIPRLGRHREAETESSGSTPLMKRPDWKDAKDTHRRKSATADRKGDRNAEEPAKTDMRRTPRTTHDEELKDVN